MFGLDADIGFKPLCDGVRAGGPEGVSQPANRNSKDEDAAHLVGINFGKQLTPTAQDLDDYGINEILVRPTSQAP